MVEYYTFIKKWAIASSTDDKERLSKCIFKKKKVKWYIEHAFICIKEVGVEIYRNLPTNM